MAGSSTADPERGSSAPNPQRVVVPNTALPSLGQISKGPAGFLAVASALQATALVTALVTPGQSHISVLISIGLGLCLLSLWLTHRTAGVSSATSRVSETTQEYSEESKATGAVSLAPAASQKAALMSPLPFMGERIAFRPQGGASQLCGETTNISRLATAARRLSVITSHQRRHPWSELMARVSHELRTPLNGVIGFSDVMASELFGPVGHPRYQEYAQHIRDCGRDLLKSAEDTLAITYLLDAEVQGHQTQVIELCALAADAWTFHRGEAQVRGVELSLDISPDVQVIGDRRSLRQVLINLLAEAISHSDEASAISISAASDCDLVQLEVFVRSKPGTEHIAEASLAICLARALLELQGATLLELDDPGSTWRAVTVLKSAAQQDLFHVHVERADQRANVA